MRMNRSTLLAALVLTAASIAAAACGGKGGGSPATNAALAGTWAWESGPFITAASFEQLKWLDLDVDGPGTAYSASPSTGLTGCLPMVYAVLNDQVMAVNAPDLGGKGGGGTYYFRWKKTGNTLVLTDSAGNETTFTRSSTPVPDTDKCGVATADAATDFVIPIDHQPSGSDQEITADGSIVWFTLNAGGFSGLDTTTMTLTSNLVLATGGFETLLSSQDGDLWLTCNCGNDNLVQRWTKAGVKVDEIDMQMLLGGNPSTNGAVWDGAHLYVWTQDYTLPGYGYMISEVDSDAEPDLVLGSAGTANYPQALAVKNGAYFTQTYSYGPVVAQIDPATGLATKTWRLPEDGVYYSGSLAITAAGDLWVRAENNDGILLRKIVGP